MNIDRLTSLPVAHSLYLHVPFCERKCIYCSFYSFAPGARRTVWVERWLRALAAEIAWREEQGMLYRDKAPLIQTLFIGGGTPTMLTPAEMEDLLALLGRHFTWAQEAEKTIESNPGTLTADKIRVLRRHGINRVSLGAQSFDDALLAAIGRSHTSADIDGAITLLRRWGYENVNLDLMFGLPGQTLATWQESLRRAVALEPMHLSLYALSIEPGTLLARQLAQADAGLASDDAQADMYAWAVAYLERQGYERYEISNFCREGHRCRHNWLTWQGKDYVGLGPGAVSTMGEMRSRNARLPLYARSLAQGRSPFQEQESLSLSQQMSEYAFLHLRTAEGLDRGDFDQRFGMAFEDIFGNVLAKYIEMGILQRQGQRLALAPNFFFVANAVLRDFV